MSAPPLHELPQKRSALMAWYVALVAILNLALGYALAVFLRSGREVALSSGDALEATASDEWESKELNSQEIQRVGIGD